MGKVSRGEWLVSRGFAHAEIRDADAGVLNVVIDLSGENKL